MHSHDREAAVVSYWRAIEMFTPQAVQKIDRHNPVRQVFAATDGLPWGPNGRQPGIRAARDKVLRHTLYIGIYQISEAYEILDRVFEPELDHYDVRTPGDSACIALSVSADGVAVQESLVLSSCAWATGRAGESAGAAFLASDWTSRFDAAVAEIADVVSQTIATGEAAAKNPDENVPLSMDTLNLIRDRVVSGLGLAGTGLVTDEIRIETQSIPANSTNEADQADFLNSFFVRDLGDVAFKVAAGDFGRGLDTYLSSVDQAEVEQRVDVRYDLDAVYRAVEPRAIPAGRWPSPLDHPAALSQQLAVNQMRATLRPAAGLFAVNGPPGTGKTTLLRDVVASVVVDRADALAELDSPDDAFTGAGTWEVDGYTRSIRHWNKSLAGHELVVASSNNAAVENVADEIPALSTVEPLILGELNYFAEIATALTNETDVAGSQTRNAWGLVAARLGNKQNRTRFLTYFWFDSSSNRFRDPDSSDRLGLNTLLKRMAARGPTEPWSESTQRYRIARQRVIDASDRRQQMAALRSELQQVGADIRRVEDFLSHQDAHASEIRARISWIEDKITTLSANKRDREQVLRKLAKRKLSVTGRVKNRAAHREWRTTRERTDIAILKTDELLTARREELTRATSELRNHEMRGRKFPSKLAMLQSRANKLRQLQDASTHTFGNFAYDESWDTDLERREVASLWLDTEYLRARSELFVTALTLHQRFMEQVPGQLRRNLTAASDLLSGRAPREIKAADALAAWQTLFFVVPVVSTTFASFARMFQHLGRESLGWLLIDEAGQAAPQSAVGAIWRSRRTIVVGDPLQLEPVVTIPFRLQKTIQESYGVGDEWIPSRTSVQALTDRHNNFGTYLTKSGRDTWVGAPLRIHRRCDEPMFSIANRIAYDGLMLSAIPEREPLQAEPSTWIDATGRGQGHWIPDEGYALEGLLYDLIGSGLKPDDIFVVSPFRTVAWNVRRICEPRGVLGGTVHTAQGKEADVVVVVLGGDPQRPGAKDWASSKPNLLNVAVSRAKRRLYVIGDRDGWAQYPFFTVLAASLPVRPNVPRITSTDDYRSRTHNPADSQHSRYRCYEAGLVPRSERVRRQTSLGDLDWSYTGKPSRIIRHRVYEVSGEEFAQDLFLRCDPIQIAHINTSFSGQYRLREAPDDSAHDFDYALRWQYGVPTECRHLIRFLTTNLAMPMAAHPAVKLAACLDWYKDVDASIDSSDWNDTYIGSLVSEAKYPPSGRGVASGKATAVLVKLMSAAIATHPEFRRANFILSVPGSKGDYTSFGERLATAVAETTDKPLVQIEGPRREQRKTDAAPEVGGLFVAPSLLTGRCLVIDDVIRSGKSVAETARAARQAGATTVHVLAAAKTRRN